MYVDTPYKKKGEFVLTRLALAKLNVETLARFGRCQRNAHALAIEGRRGMIDGGKEIIVGLALEVANNSQLLLAHGIDALAHQIKVPRGTCVYFFFLHEIHSRKKNACTILGSNVLHGKHRQGHFTVIGVRDGRIGLVWTIA